MMADNRTPKQGLMILENLYAKNPTHQGIKNNLINAYIHLGHHDKAISLIKQIPTQLTNPQNLKYRAWLAHQEGDISTEQALWNQVLEKVYYAESHHKLGNLAYRSHKDIVITPDDIPVFCVQRNELLRLPYFLTYYRKLGVTKFFFTDNNSDDGSFEFLLSQPDCYVFWTADSHNQAGAGMTWNQHLIQQYVPDNQWYLVLDADEFLVYPDCENNPLPKFTQYLDKYHYDALPSYVLDMFPKTTHEQLAIKSGDDLLKKSPYFYNHYNFGFQIESPYHKVKGGIFHFFKQSMPLNVTPLFKKRNPYIKLLSSRHQTAPTNVSDVSSCLLHFKFIGDFYQKAIYEQHRKEHASGGIAYARYAKMYESFDVDNFDFTTLDKTTEYKNSQQLVALGLLNTSKRWQYFTQGKTLHTPSEGLKLLEYLHQKHPNQDNIRNNLINTYINFNMTDKAKKLIGSIPLNQHSTQSLRFYAWLAHQNNEPKKELTYWLEIFHKKLHYLSKQERDYLLSQASTNQQKIELCKIGFDTLFNYAYYMMPTELQSSLGNQIKNVVLIANNREITLDHLKTHIQDGDLVMCFNFSVFMDFYQHFPNNPKLLFFRKIDGENHYFYGLPQSSMAGRSVVNVNFNHIFDVMRQSNAYLLFNEHLPHTLDLPDDIYQKINDKKSTGLIAQFHKIFEFLPMPEHSYFNHTVLPSSGFMGFKYLYYTRLHLINIGRNAFNIKLLGFNFTKQSFYQMSNVHNWDYERSQLENLPDSIERIMIP